MGLFSKKAAATEPSANTTSGRRGLGWSLTVHFDEFNPNTHGVETEDKSAHNLDYSPLPRITRQSFFMGVLVSMGGFVFGYDTGQISGFLAMPDFARRFGEFDSKVNGFVFSNVRSGLIVGLLSIGTLIGALLGAPLADFIGRRFSISFWCLILSAGFIIQIASTDHWAQIVVGRWVSGLGVGALSLLVPMYQAETAPRYIRGALISTYQLLITLGIFLAACFNFGTVTHHANSSASWRIVIGLGWIFASILGFGILLFPETPRFDYRRGRTEEAKRTMMNVYGAPENHYAIFLELEEIKEKLAAEGAKRSMMREWIDMFHAPRMAYRIALGMLLQMFQQLTGANYFFYYGTIIFQAIGIKNSFVTQIILNGINFGVTPIGIYLVEAAGRRVSLIAGSAWMAVMFLIFASTGHFALNLVHPLETQATGKAMIVLASLFILGFATTWGPMIWTICGELYPSQYRAKAMALSTASNWIWNFILAFFTPFIVSAIDFRYGYVFAACNVLGGFIVYFGVLEGQGRTLEELDTMYIEKVLPWKSTDWVAPPPEELARIRRNAGTLQAAEEGNNHEPTTIGEDSNGHTETNGNKEVQT